MVIGTRYTGFTYYNKLQYGTVWYGMVWYAVILLTVYIYLWNTHLSKTTSYLRIANFQLMKYFLQQINHLHLELNCIYIEKIMTTNGLYDLQNYITHCF